MCRSMAMQPEERGQRDIMVNSVVSSMENRLVTRSLRRRRQAGRRMAERRAKVVLRHKQRMVLLT